MGKQEGRIGYAETFTTSPASQGADHVARQGGQTPTVPWKSSSPSTTTSICCRSFVTAAQDVAEGEVEPGAGQYTIRANNARE